jgi:hypothetical protein
MRLIDRFYRWLDFTGNTSSYKCAALPRRPAPVPESTYSYSTYDSSSIRISSKHSSQNRIINLAASRFSGNSQPKKKGIATACFDQATSGLLKCRTDAVEFTRLWSIRYQSSWVKTFPPGQLVSSVFYANRQGSLYQCGGEHWKAGTLGKARWRKE